MTQRHGSVPGHPRTDEHLLLAVDGYEVPDWFCDEIATGGPPGVTLFRHHNVRGAAELRAFTDALQSARPAGAPPLLVAADQEGGQFLALGDDTTPFAGNLALGAVGDPDLARRVGAAIGREAAALGANVVYGPVCDVVVDPTNPALGIRSFGDDPVAAGHLAAAVVCGLQEAGVAATLKHFPGKGAIAVDTHHGLGVLDAPRGLLDDRELAPFRAALAAAPELVMSGHFAVPAVTGRDDIPATLAREVMTDLLRGELGFDGVTITDAMDMRALNQGGGQVVDAIAALAAGVDLLLCAPDRDANTRLRDGLRLAHSRRLLDDRQLEESRRRIQRLRRRLDTGSQPDLDVVGCTGHRHLADELARRAITMVRDDVGLLPLAPDPELDVLVLQPRPRDLTPADTTSTVPATLAEALRAHLPRVVSVVYEDPPSKSETAAVIERVRRADVVVLGTSNASLDPAQAALATGVLAEAKPTVAVALRAPHDVTLFASATTVLCSFGILAPTTAALADVLAGVAPPLGRLPLHVGGDNVGPDRTALGGVA